MFGIRDQGALYSKGIQEIIYINVFFFSFECCNF